MVIKNIHSNLHLIYTKVNEQKYAYKHRGLLSICYLFLLLFFFACGEKNNKKIDISQIQVPFKTVHFYKDIYAIDTAQLTTSLENIYKAHPDFAPIFFNTLSGLNTGAGTDTFFKALKHFLTYKDYKKLYDTVCIAFKDTKEIDNQLHDLLAHVKYYFPNQKWGTVYYFISGLNYYSAITVDTILGIGLDMFLGKNYPFYASVQLPEYQIVNCEPEFITVNAAKAMYEHYYPINADNKTLLDLLIAKGLEMTFVEYCLPNIKDHTLMGYNKSQWEWCVQNEQMIWAYFKKANLLFSTEWQQILRYINDGPTSTGMPPESPGNIGTWIGWQIVRSYIKNNTDEKWNTLPSKKIDSQIFLKKAKYKPN